MDIIFQIIFAIILVVVLVSTGILPLWGNILLVLAGIGIVVALIMKLRE